MTAKESKAVAWRVSWDTEDGRGCAVVDVEPNRANWPDNMTYAPLVPESALHAAEAELGELRRRVGDLADRLDNFGFTLTESRQEQLLFLIAELRLLASDGGADGDNHG